MNALSGNDLLKHGICDSRSRPRPRDRNPFTKDNQVMNIHNSRRYIGDRLIRTAKPHQILDPSHGP